MDMTYFLPRQYHRSLKWIGGKDFFDLEISPDGHRWNRKAMEVSDREVAEHAGLFDLLDLLEGDTLSQVCISALAIAGGPKTFLPSLENCIAMENVDLTIPFDDYRQPFNPMIVQFPPAWRVRVMEKTGAKKCPELVVVYRHEKTGAVSLQTYFSRVDIVSALAVPRQEFRHIDDAFLARGQVPETPEDVLDFSLSGFFQRMAMNFCLLLTHLGTRPLGWENAKEREKHEQMAGQKKNRERGELFLAGDIARVGIAQDIRLYDVSEGSDRDPESEGVSPHPHWRRGHWRNQPYGPRNILRKRIFLKPVFVCAYRFDGDLSTTSVNYRDNFTSKAVVDRLPEPYRGDA